jgi:hypothetical protein
MKLLGLSVAVAGFFAATTQALSGPPPPVHALFAITGALPVAGQPFTGLTIIPENGTYIWVVKCPALVGRVRVPAKVLRYKVAGAKPAAVTCTWRIPADAQGKTVWVSKEKIVATDGTPYIGPNLSWRVRSG